MDSSSPLRAFLIRNCVSEVGGTRFFQTFWPVRQLFGRTGRNIASARIEYPPRDALRTAVRSPDSAVLGPPDWQSEARSLSYKDIRLSRLARGGNNCDELDRNHPAHDA